MKRAQIDSSVKIAACALFAAVSLCSPVAAVAAVAELPAATPPQLYAESVRHLEQGQWFNRCIDRLEEATRVSPRAPAYHQALGAALISRAASLAEADSHRGDFQADQRKYRSRLERWNAAQNDPASPEYGRARPLPPVLSTPDDGRPLTLTREEIRAQSGNLAKRGLEELETSYSLAQTDVDRAEAKYLLGWALYILLRYKEAIPLDPATSRTRILTAFEAGVQAAPGDARLWQSLGDVYGNLAAAGTQDHDKAALAYKQALAIQPKNPPLWYRLANWSAQTGDFPSAIDALRKAVKGDADNAFLWYRMAGLLFRASGTPSTTSTSADAAMDGKSARDAVDAIERGNAAPGYLPTLTKTAVSPLLRAAWEYKGKRDVGDAYDGDPLFGLLQSTSAYARARAGRGDLREAVRSAKAMIGIGLKMAGGHRSEKPGLPGCRQRRLYPRRHRYRPGV